MPAEFLNNGEKKKKISIRGVLDKQDLAEAYNCDTKRRWRRRNSAANVPSLDQQLRVNAVDFKEALIDDVLSATALRACERRQLKPHEVTPKLYEAVRMISEVEKKTIPDIKITDSDHLEHSGLSKKSSGSPTPDGYEPENSLRRQSVATRPPQLQREGGGLRRLSHLDMPRVIRMGDETYELGNFLRRRDKQPNTTEAKGRTRRVGVLLDNPIVLTPPPTPENDKCGSPRSVRASLQEQPHSELSSLKIPENGAVSSERPANTTGLLRRRRASHNLSQQDKMNVITEVLPGLALPPQSLARTPSPNSSPASSIRIKSSPSTPSLLSHSTTGFSKTRRMSATSLTSPASTSRLMSLVESTKGSTKKGIRHEYDHRQANSQKYWESYLLQVSHSWKGFNTDTHYGY